MQNKIKRANRILVEDGPFQLLSAVGSYSRSKIGRLRAKFSDGTITHNIGEISVKVPVEKDWQINRFATTHIELDLLEDMSFELTEDDIVYDVGAYLGWHTLTASAVVSRGTVIAFEPHPITYDRLNAVTEAVSDGEVDTYQYALSDTKGNSLISTEASSSQLHPESEDPDGLEIQTMVGDELIEREEMRCPNVVRIDVEGWEVATLRGLSGAISRPECRLVYCELHPNKAPEGAGVREEVKTILDNAGFEIGVLPHGSKSLLKAIK